jgi:26S proteasome regulatory subunit N2
MPKLEFRSNARPSLYAYPAPLKKEKEKQREKVNFVIKGQSCLRYMYPP